MSHTTTPADQDDTAAVTLHAIKHTLEQITTNLYLGYHAGVGSETFESLVSALALLTKQDRAEVWDHYAPKVTKRALLPESEAINILHTEIDCFRARLQSYDALREQLEHMVHTLPGRIYGSPLTYLADADLVNILRDHLATPAHA